MCEKNQVLTSWQNFVSHTINFDICRILHYVDTVHFAKIRINFNVDILHLSEENISLQYQKILNSEFNTNLIFLRHFPCESRGSYQMLLLMIREKNQVLC